MKGQVQTRQFFSFSPSTLSNTINFPPMESLPTSPAENKQVPHRVLFTTFFADLHHPKFPGIPARSAPVGGFFRLFSDSSVSTFLFGEMSVISLQSSPVLLLEALIFSHLPPPNDVVDA